MTAHTHKNWLNILENDFFYYAQNHIVTFSKCLQILGNTSKHEKQHLNSNSWQFYSVGFFHSMIIALYLSKTHNFWGVRLSSILHNEYITQST